MSGNSTSPSVLSHLRQYRFQKKPNTPGAGPSGSSSNAGSSSGNHQVLRVTSSGMVINQPGPRFAPGVSSGQTGAIVYKRIRVPESDSDDHCSPVKKPTVKPIVGQLVTNVSELTTTVKERRFRNMSEMFPEISPMFIKNTLVKHSWNEERTRDELLKHDPESEEKVPPQQKVYFGSRPGQSGINRPGGSNDKINVCVNCHILLRQNPRNFGVYEVVIVDLSTELLSIAEEWCGFEVSDKDRLCTQCLDLLMKEFNERADNPEHVPMRRVGHSCVCLGCGISLSVQTKRRRARQRPGTLAWACLQLEIAPRKMPKEAFVCSACYQRGKKTIFPNHDFIEVPPMDFVNVNDKKLVPNKENTDSSEIPSTNPAMSPVTDIPILFPISMPADSPDSKIPRLVPSEKPAGSPVSETECFVTSQPASPASSSTIPSPLPSPLSDIFSLVPSPEPAESPDPEIPSLLPTPERTE